MNSLNLLTSSDTSISKHLFAAQSELNTLRQRTSKQCGIQAYDIDEILPLDLNQQTPSTDSVVFDIDNTEVDRRLSTVSTCSGFSMDFAELLDRMSTVDEDCALAEHGYTKVLKMTDTLQGDLWKCQRMDSDEYVCIKRSAKELVNEGIAIDKEDNTSFCVSENIKKEAILLKYLTVDNRSIGNYIVEYIDFFESENDYFLVMEYVSSETNLKQFITKAYQYITDNKLKLKHYQKVIKYLYWQLIVTVHWMHNDMNCVSLDIVTENIMLQNANFVLGNDGYYTIDANISIKLADFGVSEIFNGGNDDTFLCGKTGLSLENEAYVSPQQHDETSYDPRLADTWSLGIVLYECMVGKCLYEPMEMWQNRKDSGYCALQNGLLKEWLFQNEIVKYFTHDSLQLLLHLLSIDESKRFTVANVIENKWFKLYYNKYQKQMRKKSISQKEQLLKQKMQIEQMPFYDYGSNYY